MSEDQYEPMPAVVNPKPKVSNDKAASLVLHAACCILDSACTCTVYCFCLLVIRFYARVT